MLAPSDAQTVAGDANRQPARMRPAPLLPRLTSAEREAHTAFVGGELGADAVWNWG
jgi:hypothetical protein